jgi:hypothetical protein
MPSTKRRKTPTRIRKSQRSGHNHINKYNNSNTHSKIQDTREINKGVNKTTKNFIPKSQIPPPHKAVQAIRAMENFSVTAKSLITPKKNAEKE